MPKKEVALTRNLLRATDMRVADSVSSYRALRLWEKNVQSGQRLSSEYCTKFMQRWRLLYSNFLATRYVSANMYSLAQRQLMDVLKVVHSADLASGRILQPSRNPEAYRKLHRTVFDQLGYCPYVKQSSIQGAGRGLFVKGFAPAGSIVALYPGVCYQIDDVLRGLLPRVDTNGAPNMWICGTSTAGMFDGDFSRYSFFKKATMEVVDDVEVLAAGEIQREADCILSNMATRPESGKVAAVLSALHTKFRSLVARRWIHPFSGGNMANHPPPNVMPNVVRCHLRHYVDFPVHYFPYIPAIPNTERARWAVPGQPDPVSEEADMTYLFTSTRNNGSYVLGSSMLFIATENLSDGAEIFVDYRLHPSIGNATPSWYKETPLRASRRIFNDIRPADRDIPYARARDDQQAGDDPARLK